MKRFAVVAAIAVWFFSNAWRGLTTGFNPDDMMNLYRAWDFPALHLLIANLTPFNKVYRPFGAFFYRALFDVFGLHALPFRIAIFCVILANIALLYWLARLLTGSAEIAILAALIGSYHNRVMDIYVYGGTVYDILCVFFFTLAACVYIRARERDRPLGPGALAAFFALNILALNSKEMAATLPLLLLAYELLYRRPFSFFKSLPAWISLVISAITTVIRTGPGVAFSNNAEYKLDLSVRQFFLTSRQFLDELFLQRAGAVSTAKAVAIFAAVILIAMLSRRRDLRLAAFLILALPLPVNFISYRGFFVMYLPLLAWSIYFAILAVAIRDGLLARVWQRAPLPAGTWEPERVALFVFVLYALFNIQSRDTARSFNDLNPALARVHMLVESLARLHPSIPKAGAVRLLQNDFLEDERWTPVFIVRLYARDPTIAVDLADANAATRVYNLALTRCPAGYCTPP